MNPPAKTVLEARGLCFRYGAEPVLDQVDLDVFERDFLAIVGPNGGGKSTLVRILLGLLQPDAGEVRWRVPPRRGRLGWVPQSATFDRSFPLRVHEVVLMGTLGRRGLRRRYRREDHEAVGGVLARLDLAGLARTPIGELSGGQVQRVLIARALASSPEVLFLDEPTASLDAASRESLLRILTELSREIAIVMVTHDLGSLPGVAKNVACLNRSLYYHGGSVLSREALERVCGCGLDLVGHGRSHHAHFQVGPQAEAGAAPGERA